MTTSRITAALGAAGLALLVAGCSTATKEAPPATPVSGVTPIEKAITPTEKAVLPKPPPKAFSQSMNAADGKSALESQGYTVQINWGAGRQDRGLAACTISSVDGLRGDSPPAGTTVYLTVACP